MKKLFVLILLSFSLNFAIAQEGQLDFTEKQSDWGFHLTPYALLASQSTDVGGQKIRQSFSDLASITNAGFQIVAGIRYKRLSLNFDGTFARLGEEFPDPPLLVDLKVKQQILDLRLRYILFESYESGQNGVIKGWSVAANAGPKVWRNNLELDYSLVFGDRVLDEGTLSEDQKWTDLMLGLRSQFIISSKFLVTVDGSIGGFGWGNSSDFSSDLTYLNSFKIAKHILINAGFRSFRYSRTDPSDTGDLSTKVKVQGPILGVSFVY